MLVVHAELAPDEWQLSGATPTAGDGMSGDAVDQRIFWLVRHRLQPRASANGGWDQLYVDPRDGRLWELTFPHGSLHGGGPRRLTHLSEREASAKYGSV